MTDNLEKIDKRCKNAINRHSVTHVIYSSVIYWAYNTVKSTARQITQSRITARMKYDIDFVLGQRNMRKMKTRTVAGSVVFRLITPSTDIVAFVGISCLEFACANVVDYNNDMTIF